MRRLAMAAVVAMTAATLGGGAAPAFGCDCGSTLGPLAGGGGVAAPNGDHYVTLPGRNTTLLTVSKGSVLSWRTLPGQWGIPQVANDGSTGGLSGDGRTLVLAHYSYAYPQRSTSFQVLRVKGFRVEKTFSLQGDFSFDAISPDGSLIYLIQHPRPGTEPYKVRAYDVAQGRLLSRPIIDPTRWGTIMNGLAMTRVSSADRSRAYTLYDRGGGRTFIHALDTAHAKAVCVDLPRVPTTGALSLRLSKDGSTLTVLQNGTPFRLIDTNTYRVTAPPRPAIPAPPASSQARQSGGTPWIAVLLGGLVALAAAALAIRRWGRAATLLAWRPRSG